MTVSIVASGAKAGVLWGYFDSPSVNYYNGSPFIQKCWSNCTSAKDNRVNGYISLTKVVPETQ